MARECEICGKKVVFGNQITRRGKAKYLGGVGTKITGINPRKFVPNLQKVRAIVSGTIKRIKVCTACMRSGKLTKPPSGYSRKPAADTTAPAAPSA
jgi:large subunit ribosomal protein L28